MKKIKKVPPIIFIYRGNIPNYVYDSLKLNSHNTKNQIIFLCEIIKVNRLKIPKKIKIYDLKFFNHDLKKINWGKKNLQKYRDAFWLRTIERYFILYKFAKYYKIKNFYHAELDNVLGNIFNLHTKLNKFTNKIFFPTHKKRGFGAFMYINNLDILEQLCTFFEETIKKKFMSDMDLLGLFAKKYPKKVIRLPTISSFFDKNNKDLKTCRTEGIFDEARIGIFLFGSDPRNYCNILFNRRKSLTDLNSYKYLNKLKFEITNENFFLLINNKKIKLYNFHVHSKLLKKIFIKKFYKKIIDKSNKGTKIMIDLNLKNTFKLFFLDFRISRFKKLFKQI